MFRPTMPLSGALKFRGNYGAFRDTAIRIFVFTVFLNEVNTVPTSMSHVFLFFGIPFAYRVCSVGVMKLRSNYRGRHSSSPRIQAPDDGRVARNL